MNDAPPSSPPAWPAARTRSIALFLLAAAAALQSLRWRFATLVADDSEILIESWPWPVACANLFLPANEHTMPAGRLTTWAMIECCPSLTWLPWTASAQGIVAVLVGMVLLYHFVARERGHPAFGLLAMALFGLSSNYHEAVWWFSASFSVLSLDSLLLALLAAQQWGRTHRPLYLLAACLACALSPCWFAIGVLAGPLCTLYLLLARTDEQTSWYRPFLDWHRWTPLLGTVLFLAVSLPLTARHILHLEHYHNKTALEAFDPCGGALYTLRALTDNVLLGTFGVPPLPLPAWLTLPLSVVWLTLFALWLRRSPQPGLMLLGAAFILSSLLLTLSARRSWEYSQVVVWSRYFLFAQVGVAFIVVSTLPAWNPQWNEAWQRRGLAKWVIVATLLLTLVQVPRAYPLWVTEAQWAKLRSEYTLTESCSKVVSQSYTEGQRRQAEQRQTLAEIERVSARCREHRISAAQAQAALPPLVIPHTSSKRNGWRLLRGCDDCDPHDPVEVRRLLDSGPDSNATNR